MLSNYYKGLNFMISDKEDRKKRIEDTTERLTERSEGRSEGVYLWLSHSDCSTLLFNSLNRILKKDEELNQVFYHIMFD